MTRLRTAMATLLMAFAFFYAAPAQTIELVQEDATVWGQEQVIRGTLDGVDGGVLYLNEMPIAFDGTDGAFAVPVRLGEGENVLVACTEDGTVCTDTLHFSLGFEVRPEAFVFATAEGRTVTLHGRVLDNPDGAELAFAWAQDPDNPHAVTLTNAPDTTATFTLPAEAPPGEYYFNFTVTELDGDAFRARTFVTLSDEGTVEPFDIETDHAAWIDRAVLYEIAPRFFKGSFNGKFRYITESIPDLVALGVDTIWLQPIYATHDGQQAYDVTDYFATWDALGPVEDLHELIETAHAAGLRVMFDFVPNHTSIHHPYAQDAIGHGAASHYYDFYMREEDDAPYSRDYHIRHEGDMQFVYYFWTDLVNINFDNPEAQRHIIEASRYWVEVFDIDGYRLDAVWAPHARNPEFTKAWRLALKRIKPELFLLAEAKAPRSEAYPPGFPSIFESFDAAYDWTDDDDFISKWAFQQGTNREQTIFNGITERLRTDRLRRSLTNEGQGFHPDAKILRFIENNDTPRFIANHTPAQTKMAATLMFSLPGIPMLYYGQEAGAASMFPSYFSGRSICEFDDEGLCPFYQDLILLRTTFSALYSDHFAEVPVEPDDAARFVYAYRRWAEDEHVVGAINMSDEEAMVELALPVAELGIDAATTYYLTDLFTGEAFAVAGSELDAVRVTLPGSTTRLWALADEVIEVPTGTEAPGFEQPSGLALAPNYPNPFGKTTTISFEVARTEHVRLCVYDVLGREVARLVNGMVPRGQHTVGFAATGLASGTYLYRLESEDRVLVRSMVVRKH